MTPRALHPMYDELRQILVNSVEMSESKINEGILTFEDFIKKNG